MTFNLFSSSFVSYWPCPLQNDYQNPGSLMPGTIPDAAQLGLIHSHPNPHHRPLRCAPIVERPLQHVAAFLNLSMYFPQTLGPARSMDGCSYKLVRRIARRASEISKTTQTCPFFSSFSKHSLPSAGDGKMLSGTIACAP